MKHAKLLLLLVLVLIFVNTVPANGEYDPFKNRIDTDEPPQDHPWGGDVNPPDDDPSNSLGSFGTIYGSPKIQIEAFRIIILFDFSFDRSWYYVDQDINNDVLPGDYNTEDNSSQGDPQRGN